MKKRTYGRTALCVLCLAATMMTGCVPTEETVVQRGPNFEKTTNVELDFIQMHNDMIESFGDQEENPYPYILNVNLDGNNNSKLITIDAVCLDDTTAEEAEQFAAAAARHANDAAVTQSNEYEMSSSESFGTLYDKYGLKITVRPQSNPDDASAYLVNLDLQPGDEIPLDPNIEVYEEDWADTRDRYLEQLANQPINLQTDAVDTESASGSGSANSVD